MAISELPQSEEVANKSPIRFGLYVPQTVLPNEELEAWGIGNLGNELKSGDFYRKLGIRKRYIADPNETVQNMGQNAAAMVLEKGDVISTVIFTTSYPTGQNNARALSEHFGLESTGLLDIHAACSSFVYGLTQLEKNGQEVLIVSAEKYSPTVFDLRDKANYQKDPSLSQTIFSDGATAMRFRYPQDLAVLSYINFHFPAEVADIIKMPIDKKLITPPAFSVDIPLSDDKLRMNGREVYKMVVNNAPGLIQTAVANARLSMKDIKLIIPHQASKPILDGIAKRLGDDGEKVYYDIEKGNLSSASIPRAMEKAMREGKVNPGDYMVLSGFGAGLFSSTAVVQLGNI